MTKIKGFMKFFLVAIIATVFSTTAFAQTDPELDKNFKAYKITRLSGVKALADVQAGRTLKLDSPDGLLELKLESYNPLSPYFKGAFTEDGKLLPPVKSESYSGAIVGVENSSVRLILDGKTIEGNIYTPTGWIYVENATRYSEAKDADSVVVYKESDNKNVRPRTGEDESLVSQARSQAKNLGQTPQSSILPAKFINAKFSTNESVNATTSHGVVRMLDLHLTANFDYYKQKYRNESRTQAELYNLAALIDNVYAPQIELRVQVSSIKIFRYPDPFGTANCGTMAQNYTNWIVNDWQPTYGTNDDAFLLINTVTSCAYLGYICNESGASIGLVESASDGSANGMQYTAAHELAHVLGAQDLYAAQWYQYNPPSSIIPCSENDTNEPIKWDIMGDSGSLTFCQFSKNEVHNKVNSSAGSCLSPF